MKLLSKITTREKQVLRMIADEHNTKEIANKLNLSPHTIVSHRRSLLVKLNVKNVAGLVRKGLESGIIFLKV